jgi:hypothetical protein
MSNASKMVKFLRENYPDRSNVALSDMCGVGHSLVSKMVKDDAGVLGIQVAKWIAKRHPDQKHFLVEANRLNSVGKRTAALKVNAHRKDLRERKAAMTSVSRGWPVPKLSFPFHNWEC